MGGRGTVYVANSNISGKSDELSKSADFLEKKSMSLVETGYRRQIFSKVGKLRFRSDSQYERRAVMNFSTERLRELRTIYERNFEYYGSRINTWDRANPRIDFWYARKYFYETRRAAVIPELRARQLRENARKRKRKK
jgi:hypothetical protein